VYKICRNRAGKISTSFSPYMSYCYFCRGYLPHNATALSCPAAQASDYSWLSSDHRFQSHVASSSHASLDRYAFVPQSYLTAPAGQDDYPPDISLVRPMTTPQRGPNANNDQFIQQKVPQTLQGQLRDVLSSEWYQGNHLEPNDDLLPFIKTTPHNKNRFGCWVNGCQRLFSRRERAVNHFRSEINHRPYVCGNGACGEDLCTLGFFSQRDLQSHILKPMIDCSRCGRSVTSRNLMRHHRSKKCRRTSA